MTSPGPGDLIVTDDILEAALTAFRDALVAGAPGTMDTLAEVAAALGNDPNFATTIITLIAEKAPVVHTHTTTQVSGLAEALGEKSDVGHTHGWSTISGKPSLYPPAVHSHAVSDVSGLQEALDAAGGDEIPVHTAAGVVSAPQFVGTRGEYDDWIDTERGGVEDGVIAFVMPEV